MTGAGSEASSEHEVSSEHDGATGPNAAAFSFGKYQLFATLGRGGMADVFLAVARGPMGFNKLVVIKRLRPALAEEAAFRTMFLDEARLAARLNHPNVVQTYEVGEHKGSYFIAMEYLEGQSLNKVMKEALRSSHVIDPVFSVRLIADALVGLQHAHELRDYDGKPLAIIHRDISPHNIFASYDGHVKLVDFGIAKAANSSTQTEVGVLKGKVAYMAPEQVAGGPIDHRVDLFAMGIVLWELLTQKRLMTGDSAANTLHRLMNMPIPRVSNVKPAIDPALDAIVARALEKDPNKRFQSALHMRDELEGWIATTGRPSRQDDVGRFLGVMFKRTRDEVQRQIRTHMEAVTIPRSTDELHALSPDALHKLDAEGAPKLLRLEGSGSGASTFPPPTSELSSPSMPTGDSQSAVMPTAVASPAGRRRRRSSARTSWTLMIVLLFASFLVILLLLFNGPRLPRNIEVTSPTPPRVEVAAAVPVVPVVPVVAEALPAVGSATASVEALPLVAQPPATASPAAIPVSNNTPSPHRHPVAPNANTPSSPVRPAAPVNTQPDDSVGFLTLSTYPSTMVSEGTKAMGSTPLVKVALSPGTHVLTLENAEQGIRQQYSVTIKAGEHMKRSPAFK